MKEKAISSGDLASLTSTVTRFAARGPAPVHLWNPEHCGDIGLRIGADGTWYFQESPIGRKALVRLFATILRKDDDGKHYLVTPVEKIEVGVADAPFLAVEMVTPVAEEKNAPLIFRTNVGDEVVAGREHPLRFEHDGENGGVKPYILVRGALEALVTRALMYDLIELGVCAQVDGKDMFGVRSGDSFFPIAPADAVETR